MRDYGYEAQQAAFKGVQKLIKAREATGKWAFTYLGAGADSWNQAARMGVGKGQYVNTAKTSHGTASTYTSLVNATRGYAGGQSAAEAAAVIRDNAGV